MSRFKQAIRDRRGVSFPLIVAVTLSLVILLCGVSEYLRLLIVAQGVRDAVQEAGGLLRRLSAYGRRF